MTRDFYCAKVSDPIRYGRSLGFARIYISNMAKKASVPEVANSVLLRAYFWDEVPIPQVE